VYLDARNISKVRLVKACCDLTTGHAGILRSKRERRSASESAP